MRKLAHHCVFMLFLSVTIPLAQADKLNLADYVTMQQDMPKPQLGMTMDQVKEQYGMPLEQMPAVGNPPITRWVYHDFTVYFEKSTVINSVIPFKNKNNIQQDESQ
ncbi:MAG: hypothetical protein ACWA5R_03095 [bacterium]